MYRGAYLIDFEISSNKSYLLDLEDKMDYTFPLVFVLENYKQYLILTEQLRWRYNTATDK